MNLNKIFDKLPYGTLIGWTPGHFMGLAAGVAILVIVGMYFLLIGPSRDEYAKLEGDLKKAEETLVLYRSEGALKEPMTKEVAALSGDLVFKKRQLPMADELPSLIQKIADIGEYLSVDILSFKLAPATKGPFYKSIPLSMTISGDYYNTAGFFDSLQNLLKVFNVTNFEMKVKAVTVIRRGKKGKKEQGFVEALQTKITGNTFAYIEGSEVVK